MRVPDASSTRRFYEDLTAGRESRGIWGYEKRFDPDRVRTRPSVRRHFTDVVARWLRPTDTVLDLGCGPGGFLAAASPHCASITGVDIVPAFVDKCRDTIASLGIPNARVLLSENGLVPCDSGTFDAVIMVDAIHHCDDPVAVLDDVWRVLKPNGRLLVFEPNKGNPVLALMCGLDRNEWGLLRLGSHRAYRHLLADRFQIDISVYSGLLVGPDGPTTVAIADLVSSRPASGLLGWLSPKIFIAARRAG
jgi:SAM-dependent methyltransferase